MQWTPGTAVITGAASGLGRSLSLLLAEAGWHVCLADQDKQRLEALASSIESRGHESSSFVFDVMDYQSWQSLYQNVRSRCSSLELLINCAGVGASGEVGQVSDSQWRRVLNTNLLGTAFGCEIFVPWLRQNPGRSHVVNIASIAGLLAPPSMAAYSASKAGVIALSESLAAETSGKKPGVTVVCPGFFKSGLLDAWHFSADFESIEAHRRMDTCRWTSESVALHVLRAIDRNRRYVVVGRTARFMWRLKRIAPVTTTWMLSAIYKRLERTSRHKTKRSG